MRCILPILLLYCCACSYSGPALKDRPDSAANLSRYLTAAQWNQLFPNRYGVAHLGPNSSDSGKTDFYTYAAFAAAAAKFPAFLGTGNDTLRRRELAAFLAHIAQETSGGWPTAPGGNNAWGLYFKEEQGCAAGCPQYSIAANQQFPPVQGQSYHGRGPMQLSYNYQYGKFSEAWFGDKNVLLRSPDMLVTDPVLSFASAIWFWMTPNANKPSCHDVITGQWQPTADDLAKGRRPGFGTTLNIINGGVECGKQPAEQTLYRYDFYRHFCAFLQVSPGPDIECADQLPFAKDEH